MPNNTLNAVAVADLTAVNRGHRRRQRGRPHRRRPIRLRPHQFIEVCLSDDLSPTLPATGVLVRRSGSTEWLTTDSVDVYGDDDFHAGSSPMFAVAGDQVVCAFVNGQWRAIRRSGPCTSFVGPGPGCPSVLKDVYFSDCGMHKTFVSVLRC